jgi:hypothetical protein
MSSRNNLRSRASPFTVIAGSTASPATGNRDRIRMLSGAMRFIIESYFLPTMLILDQPCITGLASA